MNALGIRGERHPEIPEILGDGGLKLKRGAVLAKERSELEVSQPEVGVFKISLEASSKTEARKILLDGDLEKELGKPLSAETREKVMKAIRDSRPRPGKISEIKLSLAMNFQDEYRSIAHTLLKCLGMYEPTFLTDPASEQIRRFARYGDGRWEDFALNVRQNVSPVAMFSRELGNFNGVEIYFSKGAGKIIGVVTILGRLKRAVVLGRYSGNDGLMLVLERLGSNQLKGFQIVFPLNFPAVPLIEIESFPPTQNDLIQQFGRIAAQAVSWDATEADLWGKIEKVFNSTPVLNEETIGAFGQVLTESCVRIGRILKSARTETEIREVLEKNLSQLRNHCGEPTASPAVQQYVANAFIESVQAMDER
jgi:hypothetical protein